MAGAVKSTVGAGIKLAVGGLWVLAVIAIAFFVLYLVQKKQPIGFLQTGATWFANAAKGKEVAS